MSRLEEILTAEIERNGALPFRQFMETALYHPELGYYRRTRDPFGKEGDFYTAEQVQPVFGILIAERIRQLYRQMGEPDDFMVVELGAGRQEMTPAFHQWSYLPIDIATGTLPQAIRGVVFSNEFFDALPVDVVVYRDGGFRRQCVGLADGQFVWTTGEAATGEMESYLRRCFPPPEEGRWYEINLAALDWLRRISSALVEGFVLTIDYGYTRPESVRFPAGTLMSYRRHTARDEVLRTPGECDLTAHVNFTGLQEFGADAGLETLSFTSLARTLLLAGESDQFAAALGGDGSDIRRRLQLKTLLFGMGETFRVLLQEEGGKRKKGWKSLKQ